MGQVLTAKVRGQKKVLQNLRIAQIRMNKAIEKGLIRGANLVAQQSFVNAPLLYGNLKKSTFVVFENSVNLVPDFSIPLTAPSAQSSVAKMKADYPGVISESKQRIRSGKSQNNIVVEVGHSVRYAKKTHGIGGSSSPQYLSDAAKTHAQKVTVFVQDELRRIL